MESSTEPDLQTVWNTDAFFLSIFHSLLAEEARTVKFHSTGPSYMLPPKHTQMMASSTRFEGDRDDIVVHSLVTPFSVK